MNDNDHRSNQDSFLRSSSTEELEAMFRHESKSGVGTNSLCAVCRRNSARRYACKHCILDEKLRRLMT
jgi:hypothetical protein